MPPEEADFWVPDTRLGYANLVYFGLITAVIYIGGHQAINSICSSLSHSLLNF